MIVNHFLQSTFRCTAPAVFLHANNSGLATIFTALQGPSHIHRSFSTGIPSAMRFIQFANKSEPAAQRLGLVSEDGSQMVDITALTPKNTDLIQLIKAGDAGLDCLRKRLDKLTWTCVNDDITLLPPVTNPDKILCIGLNYAGHCKEQNLEPPKEPMFFSKFNNTLVGPTGNVIAHSVSKVNIYNIT